MFRKMIAILMVLVLCLAAAAASASSYTKYSKEKFTAKQRVATRTGPGTEYDEPGSFNKAGKEYKVLSKAYDYSNKIWWVQIEIKTKGGVIWAYTGAKRFSNLNLKKIPEEKVIGRCRTRNRMTGYYAPTANGCPIKEPVPGGVDCTIYGYYFGGDQSDYIQIEFYDSSLKKYRRAWVPDPFVDDYVMYYGF